MPNWFLVRENGRSLYINLDHAVSLVITSNENDIASSAKITMADSSSHSIPEDAIAGLIREIGLVEESD